MTCARQRLFAHCFALQQNGSKESLEKNVHKCYGFDLKYPPKCHVFGRRAHLGALSSSVGSFIDEFCSWMCCWEVAPGCRCELEGCMLPGCHRVSSVPSPAPSSMRFCLAASQLWTEPAGNYEPSKPLLFLSWDVRYCSQQWERLIQVTFPLLLSSDIHLSCLKYDHVSGIDGYCAPVPLPLGILYNALEEAPTLNCSLLE